jgi:hypothetical protein
MNENTVMPGLRIGNWSLGQAEPLPLSPSPPREGEPRPGMMARGKQQELDDLVSFYRVVGGRATICL